MITDVGRNDNGFRNYNPRTHDFLTDKLPTEFNNRYELVKFIAKELKELSDNFNSSNIRLMNTKDNFQRLLTKTYENLEELQDLIILSFDEDKNYHRIKKRSVWSKTKSKIKSLIGRIFGWD